MGNILKFSARVGINGMVEIRIFETICKCCLWGLIVSVSVWDQLFCVDWLIPVYTEEGHTLISVSTNPG